jgi:hypothetical protein
VVLHHGDHGVLHILLVRCEIVGRVLLLELGGQLLDDVVGVADLLAVQLGERQQTSLGPQL